MRWVIRALGALLLVAVVAIGWVVSGRGRGPVVDGRLSFAGLDQPVEVFRDQYAIPYVFAQNTPDLIRAQGFVTAQARIFQMEAYRALATGRLAEAIGERGLGNDREMRRLGLRRNAVRHAARLSRDARDHLDWYAQGINAYLREHAGDLPVELRLSGFQASPWTVDDLVTVLHFVSWNQAANHRTELTMQRVIDKLGDRAAELLPLNTSPDRQRPLATGTDAPGAGTAASGAMRLALAESTRPPTGAETPGIASLSPAPLAALGSNNWVIAPARSASGAAVVVNDPHLDARALPGFWFPIGLFSPEIRAVGAGLPAMPGILVGRNEQVAFGVTNAYGDSQDLFIERLAPGKPEHYVDGDRVVPFDQTTETIRVKDSAAPGGMREETLTIRRTVRGPIISDQPLGAQNDRLLSLRLTTADLDDPEIGIDRLLRARSAAEVDQAVQRMPMLYFNFVFADRQGTIGHRASGRVPIRRSGHGVHPKAVTGEDDWIGVIAPDRMPGQLAPARGWIATANHDTRPDDYAHEYSSYFAPPYRYERIAQVLDAGRAMKTDDQRALMMDTLNLQARRLVPILVSALGDQPEHAQWVKLLSEWDFHDRADRPAPLIYQHLYQRLVYETFVDELGDEVARAWLKSWYGWQGRFDRLSATPDSKWFDDTRTPEVETLPDLVRRAARAVGEELRARHGTDAAAWRYGDEHRLHFDAPLRRSGIGRDLLGRPARPFDGSGETVLRARAPFLGNQDVELFASMRLVADLGDDQKVMGVVSGGVVERQFHPSQKDQLDAWFAGELLPWWFDRQAIERHATHRMTLVPAGR